eukprot:g12966.t1
MDPQAEHHVAEWALAPDSPTHVDYRTDLTVERLREIIESDPTSARRARSITFAFNAHFSREWVPYITGFSRIDLSHCAALDDDALIRIVDQNQNFGITELSLYWNPQLSDRSLAYVVSACARTLTSLTIAGCGRASDKVGVLISQLCGRRLQYLDLTRCWRISTNSVRKILRRCGLLRVFRVYGNAHLSEEAFCFSAETRRNLEVLDACGTGISNENLKMLNPAFWDDLAGREREPSPGRLRVLNLTWCTKITDEGLRNLCHSEKEVGIHTLEELSLFGNLSLTDSTLHYLRESPFGRKALKVLDINGCANIAAVGGNTSSPDTQERVRQFCPHVRHFQVHS